MSKYRYHTVTITGLFNMIATQKIAELPNGEEMYIRHFDYVIFHEGNIVATGNVSGSNMDKMNELHMAPILKDFTARWEK